MAIKPEDNSVVITTPVLSHASCFTSSELVDIDGDGDPDTSLIYYILLMPSLSNFLQYKRVANCEKNLPLPSMMLSSTLAQAKGFEEIEHTADWAYRVRGSNQADLFIEAAWGLYTLAGMELTPDVRITRSVELQGIDPESLLVAWLNELLYFHDSEGLGFEEIHIRHLDQTSLQAEMTGAPVRQWHKEIKAVTYHNLSIRNSESGLEVTIVLDV